MVQLILLQTKQKEKTSFKTHIFWQEAPKCVRGQNALAAPITRKKRVLIVDNIAVVAYNRVAISDYNKTL